MLRDVVAIGALPEHRLRVTFDDGIEGVVDVAQLVAFTGVFEPLRDPEFFARATVHPELGTVCWPNSASRSAVVVSNDRLPT
jgi:hypothetical protein